MDTPGAGNRTGDSHACSTAQEAILFDDVKAFDVRVLSDVGMTNASGQVVSADAGEWVNAWPLQNLLSTASVMATLPIAIEITVDIEGWGKIRRVYELSSGVLL